MILNLRRDSKTRAEPKIWVPLILMVWPSSVICFLSGGNDALPCSSNRFHIGSSKDAPKSEDGGIKPSFSLVPTSASRKKLSDQLVEPISACAATEEAKAITRSAGFRPTFRIMSPSPGPASIPLGGRGRAEYVSTWSRNNASQYELATPALGNSRRIMTIPAGLNLHSRWFSCTGLSQ